MTRVNTPDSGEILASAVTRIMTEGRAGTLNRDDVAELSQRVLSTADKPAAAAQVLSMTIDLAADHKSAGPFAESKDELKAIVHAACLQRLDSAGTGSLAGAGVKFHELQKAAETQPKPVVTIQDAQLARNLIVGAVNDAHENKQRSGVFIEPALPLPNETLMTYPWEVIIERREGELQLVVIYDPTRIDGRLKHREEFPREFEQAARAALNGDHDNLPIVTRGVKSGLGYPLADAPNADRVREAIDYVTSVGLHRDVETLVVEHSRYDNSVSVGVCAKDPHRAEQAVENTAKLLRAQGYRDVQAKAAQSNASDAQVEDAIVRLNNFFSDRHDLGGDVEAASLGKMVQLTKFTNSSGKAWARMNSGGNPTVPKLIHRAISENLKKAGLGEVLFDVHDTFGEILE